MVPSRLRLDQDEYRPELLIKRRAGTTKAIMSTLQAMCFGAMMAWTPGLIWFAVLLWREPPELDEPELRTVVAIAVDGQHDQPENLARVHPI
jgi:hypothetical protein